MTQRHAPLPESASLPLERAFVVQFSAATPPSLGFCGGRVEHVQSGAATHFHSLEELLAFFRASLADLPSQAPAEGGRPTGP